MALLANPSASLLYSRRICPKRSDIPLSSSHRVLSFTAEKYGHSLSPHAHLPLACCTIRSESPYILTVFLAQSGPNFRVFFRPVFDRLDLGAVGALSSSPADSYSSSICASTSSHTSPSSNTSSNPASLTSRPASRSARTLRPRLFAVTSRQTSSSSETTVGVKLYSPDPPLESDVTVPESQPHGYPPWEEE